MKSIDELMKTLYLADWHACCDDAGDYLFPPHRATDGFVPFEEGSTFSGAGVRKRDSWCIDIGDGGVSPSVSYCPFCGEKLEEFEVRKESR